MVYLLEYKMGISDANWTLISLYAPRLSTLGAKKIKETGNKEAKQRPIPSTAGPKSSENNGVRELAFLTVIRLSQTPYTACNPESSIATST